MIKQNSETLTTFPLVLVVCLGYFVTYAVQTACPEGTYLQYFEDIGSCEECPSGTFMPWENHTASKCFQCTAMVNTTVEVLITPCDRFRDADIRCVEGYYRRLARYPRDEPTCLKCRESCPERFFEVHRCENFNDLGCCIGENYDYYIDKSGVRMCRERPWMCGKGEYLDTHLNDCKPCPKNTFMSEDYHSHKQCWNCGSEADLPLHATIIENCTSTQPLKYGCKDGFHVNHRMGYEENDIGCSPCKICDVGMYEVRQCAGYQDTVCCSNRNVPVAAGPLGGQCIDKIDELHIYPAVKTLRVRQGGCQSVLCYIAWTKYMRYHLELLWVGPNVNKHQQFHYENGSYQSEVTVYHNTLTVCDFSAADEGQYQCKDVHGNLKQGKLIHIVLACRTGTYNPPACNKRCSEHCRASEIPDFSPCDNKNGTCLFGCQKGYTGPMCDTHHDLEERADKPAVFASTIAVSVILVLVLTVVIICIVYIKRCQGTGPKRWQRLVSHILPQNSQESTFVEEHSMLLGVITQNEKRNLSIDLEQVKNKLRKIVNNLQQMANFCSEAAVKCQEDISEIFWNCFEFRSEIGDYVTDLRLPETCLNIQKQYLKERESIKDDETWAIINSTYKVTRDYSAGSPKFAKRLADLGAVESLTGILAKNSYLDNLNEERDFQVVKATMVGLRHMALYAENTDVQLKESRTVEVLMDLTNSDNEDIKTLAKFTVNTIRSVEEKNVKTSERTDSSIQEMQVENSKLRGDIELKDGVEKISQEKTELKDEVKKMHQENGELKDEVKTMHQENSELKDEVKKMHQENSELKDKVKKMHPEYSELKDKVKKMHPEYSELKAEVKKMHEENSKLKEVKEMHQGNSELKDEVEKMHPGDSELKDDVKKMHPENSELKDEVKRIGQGRTKLPNKGKKMKPEMAFTKLTIETLPGVEKSLSINRVKKELKEAVGKLKWIDSYHSNQSIKCQQSIYQIFWDYFPFRKDTGDHLAKLELPEICVKILRRYLEGENNALQDESKWHIIVHTYEVCRSYSEGSVKFAKSFARAGAVNLMTNILSNESYLHRLHEQGREYEVVKVSIVSLRLLAVYAGNIDDFKNCKTVEVLKPLAESENESIKLLAEITVKCISEKKENDITDTPGCESKRFRTSS